MTHFPDCDRHRHGDQYRPDRRDRLRDEDDHAGLRRVTWASKDANLALQRLRGRRVLKGAAPDIGAHEIDR
ncbi:MAG: hypothetical protein M0C28_27770 [Candidatus Moduliflexus flocculans]|nr:hypothetical protein [Candidatus Moduliflexus flocculans]